MEAVDGRIAAACERQVSWLWKAFGRIHFGWALAERGHPDALAEIEAGLDEARRIKAGRYEGFHLGLAADARSRAGQHDAAQATIAAAFAAQARSRDMPFLPDLHRLRAAIAFAPRPMRSMRPKPTSTRRSPSPETRRPIRAQAP